MSGIMMAPTDWLHEIAQGPIKTQWGQMMGAEDPDAASDEVYDRLKAKYGKANEWVIQAFVAIAPMLAEHEAIQWFRNKHPEHLWQLNNIAPEILTAQEALLWGEADIQPKTLTAAQKELLLDLFQNDPSMQPLTKE